MGENESERLTLGEKELISWLRSRTRKPEGLREAPKSIARAERVLNKIRCHNDVTDITDCLGTVDMSLYIEELASVLVEHGPNAEKDRKWYNSYILICSDLIGRYNQKFLAPYLSQIYKAEKKAKIFVGCLITLSLGNVYDFSKDIRILLTRILDKSSSIHAYVQQKKSKTPNAQLTDSAVMSWEENETFQFIELLYKNYCTDLFQSSQLEPSNASDTLTEQQRAEGIVDLLSIGLFSSSYKRGLYNLIVKYTKQRAIITLLILYEVYHNQVEELQLNRLRGFNDLEVRQRMFGRYIQSMELTMLYLLNELVLKNQDHTLPPQDTLLEHPTGGDITSTLVKLTTTQSAPNLPVQTVERAEEECGDDCLDSQDTSSATQHQWSYPITRKTLDSSHLIVAVGMIHLKSGRRLPADTPVALTQSELVLQSLIPRLFVDDFPIIFPKLYDVFLEFKASKVGLLRMTDNMCSPTGDEEDVERAELPVECQVKWKDETERYFYETLPDFRNSLPSLTDSSKVHEDGDSPKTEQSGGVEWPEEILLITDDPAPGSSQFDTFISEVLKYARSCAFIDSGTAYCVDEFARTFFLKLFDSRNNRRRIAKQFTTVLQEPNALPCAIRFAAIIDVNTVSSTGNVVLPPNNGQTSLSLPGPILKTMAAYARAQFDKEIKNPSQTRLDSKIYWSVYLSELCKFRALPVAEILDILVNLSQYDTFARSASATEVVCTILEHAGRYVAGTFGADLRLANLLSIIERVRSRTRSIPPRVEICLEDQLQILNACCARMRGEITLLWSRLTQTGSSLRTATSPQILYARYLINEVAAQGLWMRTANERSSDQHIDRYLKIKKMDSQVCSTPPSTSVAPTSPQLISFDELVRRLKTLDMRDRKVVTTLMEGCLDRNNYSPTNAHMVYFLAELANEMPHFVGVCVDELIYRVVYCSGGKQQRLLEAHMISKFLNYKLIDTTVGLDIVAYLIGLASTPHGASHFKTIFECILASDGGGAKREFPFEFVKDLLHGQTSAGAGGAAHLDVTYYREIQEEFEGVKVVEARSRLETPLAQLLFARKVNHFIASAGVSEDEEFFRYKLAIAILRNCGLSIVQRVYRSRLTFMIDILYYCISFALQNCIVQAEANCTNNDAPTQSNGQQLNLKLDFEEMSNHLNYPYTDLWDVPLACNNLAEFIQQIVKEVDENEGDFQPLLGSEHSLLKGFKASWARSIASESFEQSADSDNCPRNVTTEEDHRSPLPGEEDLSSASAESSSSSAALSGESEYECEVDNSLFDKELNLLVNESLDIAKATAPRSGTLGDLRIPAKLNAKTSADGTQGFRLVTRPKGGGKQVFRPINVAINAPVAAKATDHSDTILDRQALKRFVLERALSEDANPLEGTAATSGGPPAHYRPSEATALTRMVLYNNGLETNVGSARRSGGGSLGKRCKRNKPARVRSRTTTTFLTTDSSDE